MDRMMRSINEQDALSVKNRRDLARPPTMRTPPAMPRGPRMYREPKNKGYVSDVTTPPDGFIGGQNSRTEWMVYKALASIFGFPQDPRQGPFIGAPPYWVYQKPVDAPVHTRQIGSAVIDFVVYAGERNDLDIAIRVQTEFFHMYTDQEKQATDALQFQRIASYMQIVDIYDYDFAWDLTNQATVIILKDALAGRTEPDPINDGTTRRVTRARYISV